MRCAYQAASIGLARAAKAEAAPQRSNVFGVRKQSFRFCAADCLVEAVLSTYGVRTKLL